MSSRTKPDDRDAIRQLVKRINDAWLTGRVDALNEYFDEDIVMVPPGFAVRAEGRKGCIASFKEFIQQAAVRKFKPADPDVDVWGNTAVATFSWEIEYEMNSTFFRESGRDVFVFARDGEGWRAVWRTMIQSPQGTS